MLMYCAIIYLMYFYSYNNFTIIYLTGWEDYSPPAFLAFKYLYALADVPYKHWCVLLFHTLCAFLRNFFCCYPCRSCKVSDNSTTKDIDHCREGESRIAQKREVMFKCY